MLIIIRKIPSQFVNVNKKASNIPGGSLFPAGIKNYKPSLIKCQPRFPTKNGETSLSCLRKLFWTVFV